MSRSKSTGNMYKEVDEMRSVLIGECPHACAYCSTEDLKRPYPGLRPRYSGEIRLDEKDMAEDWGSGKRVFLAHTRDLFAEGIPEGLILRVLRKARKHPGNEYMIQTKNPARLQAFLADMPPQRILGTTVETDSRETARHYSQAPIPAARLNAIYVLSRLAREHTFITIEPVMRFERSPLMFSYRILAAGAEVVYVGADSKRHRLPEPSKEDVVELIEQMRSNGQKVILKSNLVRIIGEAAFNQLMTEGT